MTNDNEINDGGGQSARKPAATGGCGVASAPVLWWGERASMFVDETGYTPVPKVGRRSRSRRPVLAWTRMSVLRNCLAVMLLGA